MLPRGRDRKLEGPVGELKVRGLDASVLAILKARARARGVSLEEEVRSTLRDSVARRREAFARRAAACRAASRRGKRRSASDSTETIRQAREAWG